MKRRNFLQHLGAGATLSAIGGLSRGLLPAARAAGDDYRALVCVFLFGGMDNHDVVIPYERSAFDEWARIRGDLLTAMATPRTLANLLPLGTGGALAAHALPAELSGIHGLFQSGQAALVGNVGPLLEPTTRRAFEDGSASLPSRLFSHNDQQSTWMGGSPEGAQFGWGGLFLDALGGLNTAPEMGGITTGDGQLLLTGRSTVPYAVRPAGAPVVDALSVYDDADLQAALRAELRGEGAVRTHLLERDLATMARRGLDANARYDAATRGVPAVATEFPSGDLGAQLAAVARTIQAREALGACRQLFVVSMGGFDTHSNQADTLPALQRRVDEGVTAFHRAMVELGLDEQVTLFTASDFGRTLAPNDDGTDHGWGGHHFVVGGAVRGGQLYGGLPEATLGHEYDGGNGRLIPQLSVEQLAAPLGRWMGMDDGALATALPRLSAFPGPLPGFI
ncbi:MAG: DUF1501 domain-containing protein [Myxococcota bacterium]